METTAIKERPILFSGPMVRALLAGTKTQTRRIVKSFTGTFEINSTLDKKECWLNVTDANEQALCPLLCPYGEPGVRLWVRETLFWSEHEDSYCYQADNAQLMLEAPTAPILKKIKPAIPSIHMPREACRLVLEVEAVRVERLQDISEADAVAEGILTNEEGHYWSYDSGKFDPWYTAKEAYASLWESINGAGSWEANPWVWVVEFKRL